jgi:hypothetical protein
MSRSVRPVENIILTNTGMPSQNPIVAFTEVNMKRRTLLVKMPIGVCRAVSKLLVIGIC